jgi:DegV family protein with EDD domain
MCPQTTIVYDSAAALPLDLRCKHNPDLIEVPFHIIVKGEAKVWLDLPVLPTEDHEAIQTLLRVPGKLATEQPTPLEFLEAYQTAIRKGCSDIVVVTISGSLSGSASSAHSAVGLLQTGKHGKIVPVRVADSRAASVVEGLIVLEAQAMAVQGAPAIEIVEMVESKAKDVPVALIIGGLDHLVANGRIGKAAGTIGGILGLKPIISLEDGVVKALTSDKDKMRMRGWHKALDLAVDKIYELVGDRPVKLGFVHYQAPLQLAELMELVEKRFNQKNVGSAIVFDQTHVINTHGGIPNVGFAAWPLDN